MAIKYTNIFHFKALQNLHNLEFWFENKPSGNPGLGWGPNPGFQCTDIVLKLKPGPTLHNDMFGVRHYDFMS
jgi:hypothetical protein